MANEPNKKDKRFFKDFKAELKKVIWPSSKQLVNSTMAVVVIVLIIAAIVLVLDVAFESLNTYGIEKIKSLVTSSDVNDNSNVLDNTEGDNTGNIVEPTSNVENTGNTVEPTPEVENNDDTVEPSNVENVENTDTSGNTEESDE